MRLPRAWGLIGVVLALVAAPTADAAPLRLDTGFGEGGIARVPVKLWNPAGEFTGVLRPVRQPDGKVLVVAQVERYCGSYSVEEVAVARVTRDGETDRTFGRGGRVRLGFPGGLGFHLVTALVQADGRIVLVGNTAGAGCATPRSQLVVVRLLPNGSRDPTFGTNGFVVWNPPWHASKVWMDVLPALALTQPGGRLLVAATVDEQVIGPGETAPERHSFMFVRFEPDGSVDGSFARGGVAELDRQGAYVEGWARLPDGRLVALVSRHEGPVATYASTAWWVQSFAADLSSAGGFATESVRLGLDVLDNLVDLAPTRDGGLVMTGNINADQRYGPVPAVRRILPDGSLDPTFGRGCGRPLLRLRGSFTRGGLPTSDGGMLVTATRLLIHARPRRVDGFAINYDATGCIAGTPLRLRSLAAGPPLLQRGGSALLGATFNNSQGLAGGLALIKIRR